MTTANLQRVISSAGANRHPATWWLLACGIAGAAVYPITDVLASTRYPGFSYRDQAVSELFALGAPTASLVTPLFSLSSTLLLFFALGIVASASGRRSRQWLAALMALNAIDALILWNAFPMHMRGTQPTITDMMHGALAIDPFLLGAVIVGAVAFRGAFRIYTIATIVFTVLLAMAGFSFATDVFTGRPTPWMGATERAAQYATNAWYAVLALKLMREGKTSTAPALSESVTRLALSCGLIATGLYGAMLIFVPLAWRGYSSTSQTISELSAIGAPTRMLWVPFGTLWVVLYGIFALGVWATASQSWALRSSAIALTAAALAGIFWPPMHLREVLAAGGATLTDTLHIVWTATNAVLTLAAMGFAAVALGRRFRIYTIASMVTLFAAGVVTSRSASQLQANLPTPWMGAWERVNIGAWLLWVAVLAVVLLQRPTHMRLLKRDRPLLHAAGR